MLVASPRLKVLGLRKTRHRNILQFYGACTKPPNLAIVTAFCDGDSLYDMIHGNESWLSKVQADAGKNAYHIAQQVTVAMQYLHKKCNIIHRDLKSNNIFIEQTDASQSRVQIGDFGLALLNCAKKKKSQGAATSQGSVVWMAPEIIKMKSTDEPYVTTLSHYTTLHPSH